MRHRRHNKLSWLEASIVILFFSGSDVYECLRLKTLLKSKISEIFFF